MKRPSLIFIAPIMSSSIGGPADIYYYIYYIYI
jgi:hypothetical protein